MWSCRNESAPCLEHFTTPLARLTDLRLPYSFAETTSKITVDSSDEEVPHVTDPPIAEKAPPMSRSVSLSTQTQGTWIDHLQALAAYSSLTVVEMNPIRDQFWDSILACLKMPRGGVNGGGSMRCSFEFVCANEAIVKHLMEDLPIAHNQRYNLTIPSAQWSPPVYWEKSATISTYYAEDLRTMDSFFRLHRRRSTRRHPAYRGSILPSHRTIIQLLFAKSLRCRPSWQSTARGSTTSLSWR